MYPYYNIPQVLKESKSINLLKTCFRSSHNEGTSSCLRENDKLHKLHTRTSISQNAFYSLTTTRREYRHNKINGKQINKFDRLIRKCNGYYNFGTFTALTAPTTTTTSANTSDPAYLAPCTTNQVGHQLIHHLLTSAQETILARGSNFAIVPKYPPRESYLSGRRGMYQTLPKGGRGTLGGIQPVTKEKLLPFQTRPHMGGIKSNQGT